MVIYPRGKNGIIVEADNGQTYWIRDGFDDCGLKIEMAGNAELKEMSVSGYEATDVQPTVLGHFRQIAVKSAYRIKKT